MSVDRQFGDIIFICDTCGEDLDTAEPLWNDAQAVRKKQGWAAIYDDEEEEWKHFCKDCKP